MIFNDRFQYTKYRGLSYIAGSNKVAAVGKTLEKKQGTTIGVMDNQGNILKNSTRTSLSIRPGRLNFFYLHLARSRSLLRVKYISLQTFQIFDIRIVRYKIQKI
jgi:hypothetical protein